MRFSLGIRPQTTVSLGRNEESARRELVSGEESEGRERRQPVAKSIYQRSGSRAQRNMLPNASWWGPRGHMTKTNHTAQWRHAIIRSEKIEGIMEEAGASKAGLSDKFYDVIFKTVTWYYK